MPGYRDAERCCDLVMKGGITSGILYPPAICRIAESFHLVGIGGTSAGAIAACAAAAAEYRRRQSRDNAGFEILEQLPHMLAGEGRLLGLFRPDQCTKSLFRLLIDALELENRSRWARLRWKARAVWAGIRHKHTLRPAVDNGFGLCTGMANGNPRTPGGIEPLTEWLTNTIDTIAGKQDGTPLTFGDLRHARIPAGLTRVMTGKENRSIDLRAVTTCVSFGRPYELPFEDTHVFAFDPRDMERLFPAKVVDYLVDQARQIEAPSLARDGKLPFPVGDAMPVVVAARMSLSFPGLFTMVPLYAVNYEDPGKPMTRVWFSDGGITSNIPIHRFDGVFPRWPTLAINLQYTDNDGRPARRNVDPDLLYMIARPGDGTRDLWNAFDGRDSPIKNMVGFAGAVFRSAQVWHDNGFLRLPGYRDRVIEIWLKPDEGGMNLTMPKEVVERLIARGEKAGKRLRDRFVASAPADDELSWDGHRWTRLRSAMAGLAEYLHAFRRNVEHPMPGDRTLVDLLQSRTTAPLYKFRTEGQYEAAKQAIEDLLAYVERLDVAGACAEESEQPYRPFCDGPRPPVEIGSRAPI
jgi:predicted acylesterase/phospholipase RssA